MSEYEALVARGWRVIPTLSGDEAKTAVEECLFAVAHEFAMGAKPGAGPRCYLLAPEHQGGEHPVDDFCEWVSTLSPERRALYQVLRQRPTALFIDWDEKMEREPEEGAEAAVEARARLFFEDVRRLLGDSLPARAFVDENGDWEWWVSTNSRRTPNGQFKLSAHIGLPLVRFETTVKLKAWLAENIAARQFSVHSSVDMSLNDYTKLFDASPVHPNGLLRLPGCVKLGEKYGTSYLLQPMRCTPEESVTLLSYVLLQGPGATLDGYMVHFNTQGRGGGGDLTRKRRRAADQAAGGGEEAMVVDRPDEVTTVQRVLRRVLSNPMLLVERLKRLRVDYLIADLDRRSSECRVCQRRHTNSNLPHVHIRLMLDLGRVELVHRCWNPTGNPLVELHTYEECREMLPLLGGGTLLPSIEPVGGALGNYLNTSDDAMSLGGQSEAYEVVPPSQRHRVELHPAAADVSDLWRSRIDHPLLAIDFDYEVVRLNRNRVTVEEAVAAGMADRQHVLSWYQQVAERWYDDLSTQPSLAVYYTESLMRAYGSLVVKVQMREGAYFYLSYDQERRLFYWRQVRADSVTRDLNSSVYQGLEIDTLKLLFMIRRNRIALDRAEVEFQGPRGRDLTDMRNKWRPQRLADLTRLENWPREWPNASMNPSGSTTGLSLNLWCGLAPHLTIDHLQGSRMSWASREALEVMLINFTYMLHRGVRECVQAYRFWATVLQRPGVKMQIVHMYLGNPGLGKSTYLALLHEAIGRHSIDLKDIRMLAGGNFTCELEQLILAVVDEGDLASDPAVFAALKNLITSQWVQTHLKYQNPITTRNLLNILISTNMQSAGSNSVRQFPFDKGERRWAVHQADTTLLSNRFYQRYLREWLEKHPECAPERRKASLVEGSVDWWRALNFNCLYWHMDHNGGKQAFLWFLHHVKLPEEAPEDLNRVPETSHAETYLKLHSTYTSDTFTSFLLDLHEQGEEAYDTVFEPVETYVGGTRQTVRASPAAVVYERYKQFVKLQGYGTSGGGSVVVNRQSFIHALVSRHRVHYVADRKHLEAPDFPTFASTLEAVLPGYLSLSRSIREPSNTWPAPSENPFECLFPPEVMPGYTSEFVYRS